MHSRFCSSWQWPAGKVDLRLLGWLVWKSTHCLQVNSHVDTALKQGKPMTDAQQQALAADMQLEVNALRNAAYARGFTAAKRAVAARVLGEWD